MVSKYGNKKITADGMSFDSSREYKRYCELRLLEKAGKIRDLQMQVKFELLPSQKVNGKVAERACNYIADFTYIESLGDGSGQLVVEDTKGFKTKDYIIKRKLMLYVHGLQIREV